MNNHLLNLFRPEKKVIWQQLCKEIDADFIPAKGFLDFDSIQAYHNNWTVVIDNFKKGKRPTHTRIRAPYINADGFQFRIFGKPLLDFVAKNFRSQDVLVGFKGFDDDFIIQGNDEHKLRQLFENNNIRKLISRQYPETFLLENRVDHKWSVKQYGKGVSELYFHYKGLITDLDQLWDLYDLFGETLHQLCHIGSAYEDDPLLK